MPPGKNLSSPHDRLTPQGHTPFSSHPLTVGFRKDIHWCRPFLSRGTAVVSSTRTHGCLVLLWTFSPTPATQLLAPISLVNGSLVRLQFIAFPCPGPLRLRNFTLLPQWCPHGPLHLLFGACYFTVTISQWSTSSPLVPLVASISFLCCVIYSMFALHTTSCYALYTSMM